MAAMCTRSLVKLVKTTFLFGIGSCSVIRRLPVTHLYYRFTWSQLKFLHSQSSILAPAVFSQSSSSRFSWRWMMLMVTAGFSQGFLGFNFGKKDEEKKDSDPLMRVYMEAKEAHIKQDFSKAEIRYHDALKVADEMLKLKKINFKTYIYAKTNIYDSLADMALGLGELEKAERLYKETMKGCLQQGLPQDDNAIIELSIKLASICAMMGRNPEAEQGLLSCIKAQDAKLSSKDSGKDSIPMPDAIKEVTSLAEADDNKLVLTEESKEADAQLKEEEKLKDTEALLGMALETYGRFLMGQRRLTEAVQALERALNIAGKVLGTDKGQYMVLMNDLATAHILMKNYEKASEILNNAIESATKMKSSYLPVLYCNLGAVFLRTSRLEEAERACQKGQELSKNGQHSMAFSMSQKCLEKIHQVKKTTA